MRVEKVMRLFPHKKERVVDAIGGVTCADRCFLLAFRRLHFCYVLPFHGLLQMHILRILDECLSLI